MYWCHYLPVAGGILLIFFAGIDFKWEIGGAETEQSGQKRDEGKIGPDTVITADCIVDIMCNQNHQCNRYSQGSIGFPDIFLHGIPLFPKF